MYTYAKYFSVTHPILNGTEKQTYFYRRNLQGDVTHVFDEAGILKAKYAYDAWGNCKTIYSQDGIATLNPIRYRGYYFDNETGLYFLQSRYYDPQVGRFISPDSIEYLDPETINGLNLYAYCLNNPVLLTDSTGCSWWTDFWASTTGQVLAWIGVGVILAGLTVATIFTFGAAAPITGLAATMVVGATIGAFVGVGASLTVQTQGFTNWNNIDSAKLFTSGVIGGLIGAVSGAMSFGFAQIGKAVGEFAGVAISSMKHLGTGIQIGKVFTTSLLVTGGKLLGGFAGGFIGGKMGNEMANLIFADAMDYETGMLGGVNLPRWLVSIIRMFGK